MREAGSGTIDSTTTAHPAPFRVEVTRCGAAYHVEVTGELDVMNAPRLRNVVFDPSVCPGPTVVLDLRAVTFLDSVGIGAIVAARRRFGGAGGALSVRAQEGPIARVLRSVGLETFLALRVDAADPADGRGESTDP